MAKMKVHELAKELEIQSKDILAFLKDKGIDAKAAQSSIEDDAVGLVKSKFKTGAAGQMSAPELKKPEPEIKKPEPEVKNAEPETQNADDGDEPKKKKKIIFVSNPQNSKIPGSRPQQNNDRRPQQGSGQNAARPQQNNDRRPQGQGGYSKNSNRQGGNMRQEKEAPYRPIRPLTPPSPTPPVNIVPANNNIKKDVKPTTVPEIKDTNIAAANTTVQGKTEAVQREERPIRTNSTEYHANRPNSDRPNSDRPNSDRPNSYKPNSDRTNTNRPNADRPSTNRPGADRPNSDRPPYRRNDGGTSPRPDNRGPNPRYNGGNNTGNSSGGYAGNNNGGYAGNNNGNYAGNNNRNYAGNNTGNNTGTNAGRPDYRGGTNFRSDARPANTGDRSYGGANRTDQRRPAAGAPGSQGNNRGYAGNSNSGGGSRPYGNNDRTGRVGGGPDNKFRSTTPGKAFTPEGAGKDTEKHREDEKRRIAQEKDKRSRKDHIYEDDNAKKQVKNKAGKFIKPDKKAGDQIEEQIKTIVIPEILTIKELADKMKLQPSAIIKKLFLQGTIVTVNTELSFEDAENIAIENDIICEREVKIDVIEELLKEEEDNEENLITRAPVICVMGHVDHGKTSLLDAIRKTSVTDKEAGGITQHIGAYTVHVNNQKITFLDTPGHEAFTAMRMRGANATDIAILVVAADDGVMPQTVEAINHAKAAGIEIVVAVNKMDKPNANIDRVKQEMTEYELIPVDWGGTTEFVPVSAKSGDGIENLLETILLTSEILELKANPLRTARGLVIEAELDKGRGPVATILVQKGTLRVGDFVSAGASHGKVRAMIDDKGRRVKEAMPSTPVEILGLSDVPSAGEVFLAHDSDKTAKTYADTYQTQNKERMIDDTKAKMSLDDLFTQIKAGNLKELNIIVKADVQGSVEAVKQSLLKLSNEEVVVKCIHGGVGAINESDVSLASASQAIIIGFNVRPDATAKQIAEREGVDMRLYKVIYQAIEDVEAAMKGMLDPVFEEKITGHAEVRQIFKASAIGNIAGSYVLDGMFQRDCKVRVTRAGELIFEGGLSSLKRFKDDVKEVKSGFECGFVFDGFDQIQEQDIVEAYVMVEVPR